jgi:DNA-binding transcriptional ArsR family regulator
MTELLVGTRKGLFAPGSPFAVTARTFAGEPVGLTSACIQRIRYVTMSLTETFAALGDPTRLAILERLAEGDATVKELAEPFSVSLPAISRHLKVLERAGLITRGRTAQSRPSSLRVDALKDATMWMNARREMWEGRMDRLDRHLQQIQKGLDDG